MREDGMYWAGETILEMKCCVCDSWEPRKWEQHKCEIVGVWLGWT